MRRWFAIFVIATTGCCGLPCDVARYAGEHSSSCGEAARKTFGALSALEFEGVRYVQGYVQEGNPASYHAWVEYTDAGDVVIIDPYAILDPDVMWWYRDDLFESEYVVDVSLEEIEEHQKPKDPAISQVISGH